MNAVTPRHLINISNTFNIDSQTFGWIKSVILVVGNTIQKTSHLRKNEYSNVMTFYTLSRQSTFDKLSQNSSELGNFGVKI